MSDKITMESETILTIHSNSSVLPTKSDMIAAIQKVPDDAIINDIGIYGFAVSNPKDVKIIIKYQTGMKPF